MTVIRGANLTYQWNGDAALLHDLAEGADVLVLVECRDRQNNPVDVAKILGPGWWVWQDMSSGERAGTVIACRKSGTCKPAKRQRARDGARVVVRRVSALTRLSTGNHEVQARYLRSTRLRDTSRPIGKRPFTVFGDHIPLKSSGKHGGALKTLAKKWGRTVGRKLALGDGNASHNAVRDALRALHSEGADVMHAVWGKGWGEVDVTSRHMEHTDHHVLTVHC